MRPPVRAGADGERMTNTPMARPFTDSLDREWRRLRRHPDAVRRARSWSIAIPDRVLALQVAGLDDLQDLLDITRGRGASELDADAALRALVEIAQGDQLAGRVVIQRILPGLITRSARYRTTREPVDPAEIAVAAAWIVLAAYSGLAFQPSKKCSAS